MNSEYQTPPIQTLIYKAQKNCRNHHFLNKPLSICKDNQLLIIINVYKAQKLLYNSKN